MATVSRDELVGSLIVYAGEDYVPQQDSLIEAIVEDAIEEVRDARYPFGYTSEKQKTEQEADVLLRYPGKIRRIMQYHYDKIGKSGVTTFYEAGQTTSWESGGTPRSYFRGIVPVAKLV